MAERIVFQDGEYRQWQDATIPVDTVAVKYGANVFEGICVYASRDGNQNTFRLEEHLARLAQSLRLCRIDATYTDADFQAAIVGTLKANEITGDAHVRLSVLVVGEGRYDVRGPTSLVCVATKRPAARELRDLAISACISSWKRIDDLSVPPRIKAGANYHNSRFAMLEARANGYDEAIFLNDAGKVSEATAACFMMFQRGVLVTPPVSAGLLESVTRDSMLRIASEELGIPSEVRDIDRTETYSAEEVFLCNSFEEVRPVVEIDRLPIGDGTVGPLTNRLWEVYENVARSPSGPFSNWLTPIDAS